MPALLKAATQIIHLNQACASVWAHRSGCVFSKMQLSLAGTQCQLVPQIWVEAALRLKPNRAQARKGYLGSTTTQTHCQALIKVVFGGKDTKQLLWTGVEAKPATTIFSVTARSTAAALVLTAAVNLIITAKCTIQALASWYLRRRKRSGRRSSCRLKCPLNPLG